MSEDDLEALLRTGIEAAQSGRPGVARGIFDRILARDPNHETAWLWKANVAETLDERRACLRRVLVINPENQQAGQALEALRRQTPAPAPRKAAPRPEPDDRAALLGSIKPPRNRRRIVPFALMAVALAMMAAGAALIINARREAPRGPDATATIPPNTARTATFQALSIPPATATATPGERVRTLPPRREELPPTWTPTTTWTPSPEGTPPSGESG